jgi:hypothetical protein
MHPDTARELKARILQFLHTVPPVAPQAGGPRRHPRIAVGLAPAGSGRARVAVRLENAADRALLPELPRAAEEEVDLRVIGRVLALPGAAPVELQRTVRPLRPGLSLAHPSVTAGTLGGFVRSGGRLAIVSNNHVLAASDTAPSGIRVCSPARPTAAPRPTASAPSPASRGCAPGAATWSTPPSPSWTPTSRSSPAPCPAVR